MIAGRIFTLRGRAGRLEYISHIVGGVLLYVVTLAITESVLPVLLMFLFVVADEICVAVRRLHDLDRPSSDYWLLLIPIYNIYLSFVLLLKKGTDGPNQYDEDLLDGGEGSREYVCSRCGAEVKYGDAHCARCGDVLEF
jgi:uncharacterized membrane protein YhaH (DUF805 family)